MTILIILVGFYIAWNIGANDVGNNMGTSVSAGSISYKNAVILAVVFEFLGALLVGGHVVKTIKGNIVDFSFFQSSPEIFVYGMFAVIIAAGIWITLATILKLPISTTHAIIGAMLGFGLAAYGAKAIHWGFVGIITLSWIFSPIIGAIISFIIFNIFKYFIYNHDEPFYRFKRIAPIFVFIVGFVLTLATIYKGLKNLKLDLGFVPALIISIIIGVIAMAVSIFYLYKKEPSEDQVEDVESFSKILHVISASYECFAHGANDVANAIGPIAAIITITATGTLTASADVPLWLLLLGSFGMVVGIVTMGHRVMETIGKRITEITPSRGFAAEFSAATTVLLGSRLGIPLSSTHISVGAVTGVGLARGIGSINLKVLGAIFLSWFLTVPLAALLCAGIFHLIKFFA